MAQVLDSNKNLQKVLYYVMAAPGILQAVICPGKVQKRNMYIPTSQPAMPMQVRQDLQDVSMKIW